MSAAPVTEVSPLPDPSVGWSLSPSRASDFMSCPLLYRFRVVDRLPEPPGTAALRGTLVHQVLEDLFDLPAPERTLEQAQAMVPAAWERVRADEPDLDETFADAAEVAALLEGAEPLLRTYFALEDPSRIEPTARELRVETTLPDGLVLRGFVDRLDTNAAGQTRVVDYKTGRSPGEMFEQKALFQMRFYALVLWRSTGVLPTLLQLVYLGNGEILRYQPDEADLRSTERKLHALWQAISRAHQSGDWRPNRSRLCDWCHHRDLCPAWGGTPPPLPAGAERLGATPPEDREPEPLV